ncbi:YihY/virulence factor BrkB family protein [Sporolactobacillus sp. KGMB 08714]|uniref:YihY/virulence factor BrkB family protein n=1 Tax=Sporolactobacillus sp. KGMB 08714 TaxID=3064704 RepID=UPI002FBE8C68
MGKVGKKKKFREMVLFIKLLGKRFVEDNTADLAATLAYYFLLSLFPLVIFLFAVLPYMGLTQQELLPFLSRYLPGEVMSLIRENLGDVFTRSGGLLSIGIIATFWAASNAINALIRTLNHAYHVKETRSFIVIRMLAMILTLAMVFAIVLTLAVNVFSVAFAQKFFQKVGIADNFADMWSAVSPLLTFVVVVFILAYLYALGPNMRLKLKEVRVGALLAGSGWQAASYGFSFYVRYFGHYSATYGTLGGIIILMLWFYITAMTIIVGGQINAILHHLQIGRGM